MNDKAGPCQSQSSDADQQHCFIAASKKVGKDLNRMLARVEQVLSSDEQKDLQHTQKLWLEYREANCSAERNLYAKGSAAPTAYHACLYSDTQQRVRELKTVYGWRLEKFGTK